MNKDLGVRKKLTPREEELLLREMKKDPFTSALKLATTVVANFNKEVHAQLCRRMLWKNNFHGRVPREKLHISKKSKLLCLKFAKDKRTVWKKSNKELDSKNWRLRNGYRAECLLIGNLEISYSSMESWTKLKYLNILKENFIDSAEKLNVSRNFCFQQDRDSKHTAKTVQEWISDNVPHSLTSPYHKALT
ncbi:uncharacterized protein LOC122531349 [Frieseomelitta varia]|uniref:uncharacterized protein LOC122531349 n=1 Tax=Frieseomelitta varia TaxID=561572 RepID=UPI001CB67F41|nr:uncharacterized protein LOC122531349 [Frieseomelitta varia]